MTQYDKSFSWERMKMVAAYYYPVLKPQMIWFPIAVVVLYSLAVLCQMVDWLAPVGAVLTAPFSFMLYLAPIVLARRDNRLVTSMLPATAVEKVAFLAAYFFVMVPLMIFGVEYVLIGITELVAPEYNFVINVLEQVGIENYLIILNQLDELIPLALCFWGVIYFKENRTLKAILVSIGGSIAMGIVGAIYGIAIAAKAVLDAKAAGVEFNPDAFEEDFSVQLAQNIEPLVIGLSVLSVLIIAFMIWCSYRRIKNYQI